MDKWFTKSDQNGDGYLDLSEVKPYLVSFYKTEFGLENIGTAAIMEMFTDMDLDADNKITKEELFQHIRDTLDLRNQ